MVLEERLVGSGFVRGCWMRALVGTMVEGSGAGRGASFLFRVELDNLVRAKEVCDRAMRY